MQHISQGQVYMRNKNRKVKVEHISLDKLITINIDQNNGSRVRSELQGQSRTLMSRSSCNKKHGWILGR